MNIYTRRLYLLVLQQLQSQLVANLVRPDHHKNEISFEKEQNIKVRGAL